MMVLSSTIMSNLTLDDNRSAHRFRLIDGMVAAVSERGYAATTIADVVRAARVSKRTFYEHFSDKEECLLAAYTHLAQVLLDAIAGAVDPDRPLHDQLRKAVLTYLATLEEQSAVTRTVFTEILAAGPRGLQVRREVLGRFADMIRGLVALARVEQSELRELSPELAMAVVGGIDELVLDAVERGRADRLTELADPAVELLRSVLTAH